MSSSEFGLSSSGFQYIGSALSLQPPKARTLLPLCLQSLYVAFRAFESIWPFFDAASVRPLRLHGNPKAIPPPSGVLSWPHRPLVAVWATIAITFCYEINFWCPAARAAQNLAALQHFIGKTGACQFSSAPRHVLAGERKHNRYKDIFALRKRSCAPTIQYTKAPNVRLYRLIIYRLAGWKYYISEISDIRHLGAHRVPAIISPSKDKFSPHTLS